MNIYKHNLFKLFPVKPEKPDDPKAHSYDDYISIYDGIKNSIPFKDRMENQALRRFLYAACVKFDRFSVPTPTSIDAEYFISKLSIFLRALEKTEPASTENTQIFALRKKRAELYNIIHMQSVYNIDYEQFTSHLDNIENDTKFRDINKLKSYKEEVSKLKDICLGIENKTLKTTFLFTIPYIFHESSLKLSFIWNTIPCTVSTTNSFNERIESFVSSRPMYTIGASRWNAGETSVKIEFAGLVDASIASEPMQMFLGIDLKRHEKWPFCFNCCYEILKSLHWKIKLESSSINNNVPVPPDLGGITYILSSSSDNVIEQIFRTSPAFVLVSTPPSQNTVNLNFDNLELPLTHRRYRSTAEMYLEMGMISEAIFWLNAGIEAFFEYKFTELQKLYDNLLEDLKSSKPFYEDAEAILADQFPHMKGEVKWPVFDIHSSMFTKLKYVSKKIPLTISTKVLISNYTKINKYRNDLFHGRSESIISIEWVKQAFEAFDFLVLNFNSTVDKNKS